MYLLLVTVAGHSAVQAIELLVRKGVPEDHIIFLNLISVNPLQSLQYFPGSQCLNTLKLNAFFHNVLKPNVCRSLVISLLYCFSNFHLKTLHSKVIFIFLYIHG